MDPNFIAKQLSISQLFQTYFIQEVLFHLSSGLHIGQPVDIL